MPNLPIFPRARVTLQSLPNELLLAVTDHLSPNSIKNLLGTNRYLSNLMKPLLNRIAQQDKDGLTALCWASRHGHAPLVELLLDMGAEIGAPSGRFDGAPLQWATYFSHGAIVKILLERGANPMARDRFGATVLHSALHSDEQTVRLLLEHGADPNARDIDDETPLHYASFRGNGGMIRLLLEHGADVNFRTTDGESALHGAVDRDGKASSVEQKRAIALLLAGGIDVEIQDYMGRTALHRAAEKCHPKVVKLLLGAGANVNAADLNGESPLHLVIRARMSPNARYVAQLLISKGASLRIENFLGESVVSLGKRYGVVGSAGWALVTKSTAHPLLAKSRRRRKGTRTARVLLDR